MSFQSNPAQFITRNGRRYWLEEKVQGHVERDVARHDYHHEGCYVHTEPLGGGWFTVYCAIGYPFQLSCCKVKRMGGVEEERYEVRQDYKFDRERVEARRKLAKSVPTDSPQLSVA